MLIKRFLFDQEHTVPVTTGGTALPDFFLLAPAVHVIGGVSYDMTAEGYYIFADFPSGVKGRRLVTNADALNFCSAFAWAAVHGGADAWMSNSQLDAAAKTYKPRLPCGVLHPWIRYWAHSAGFLARITRFLTAETPNNYNDGHVGIEICNHYPMQPWTKAGPWMLADCTLGQYYTAGGNPLSLYDTLPRVPTLDFEKPKLADDVFLDVAPPVGTSDVTTFSELLLRTPSQRDQWLQRIYQIPGIDDPDGYVYCYMPQGTESRKSWVESLGYRVISESAWLARFYQTN